ncbi:MAG: hypothetical protein NVSMB26_20620 [Beijerinckiaceae bacterium]
MQIGDYLVRASAKVTSKGQVTIPLDVRNALSLKDGDRLEFIQGRGGAWTLLALNATVEGTVGLLKHRGPRVSVEQMDEAIAQAMREDTVRIKSRGAGAARTKRRA